MAKKKSSFDADANYSVFEFKGNLYKRHSKSWFLAKEREALGFNIISIIGENMLKIEKHDYKSLRELNEVVLEQKEYKDMLIVAIITNIEYKISNAGRPFYWIHLSDDWLSTKIYCNQDLFSKWNQELIVNKCVLFNISVKNDFIKFDKCITLDKVPFKSGYIFVINLEYGKYTDSIKEYIEDELDVTIRKGICPVYLRTRQCDGLFIDPTYELIETIYNKFNVKCSIELENDFLWKDANKLIDWYEQKGY